MYEVGLLIGVRRLHNPMGLISLIYYYALNSTSMFICICIGLRVRRLWILRRRLSPQLLHHTRRIRRKIFLYFIKYITVKYMYPTLLRYVSWFSFSFCLHVMPTFNFQTIGLVVICRVYTNSKHW